MRKTLHHPHRRTALAAALVGLAWTTGGASAQNTSALTFGEADIVLVPPSPVLPTVEYTITALIRTDPGVWPAADACVLPDTPCQLISPDTGSPRGTVVSRVECDVGSGPANGWWLRVSRCGRLVAAYEDQTTADARFDSGIYVADGEWHFVALRRNGVTGELTFQVDCQEVSCVNDKLPVDVCDAGLSIGARQVFPGSATDSFRGTIDEVTLWSRELSRLELDEVRVGDISAADPTLVGHWRFEENGGQVALDASQHGNHGQLGLAPGEDASDPLWLDEAVLLADLPFRCVRVFDGLPMVFSAGGPGAASPATIYTKAPGAATALAPTNVGQEHDALGIGFDLCGGADLDVDAFSLGLDILPVDPLTGVLLREVPVPGSANPAPIWGALMFSTRGGTGRDGRSMFSYTWGIGLPEGCSGTGPLLDGGTSRSVRPEDWGVTEQDVDAVDFFAWLYQLSSDTDVFWSAATQLAGPPVEPPSVYFSVTSETAGSIPLSWCGGDPAYRSGATIFRMDMAYVSGPLSFEWEWQCPVVSEVELVNPTCGSSDPSAFLTFEDDVDALAFDRQRNFAIYSTRGSNAGDRSDSKDPFLFRNLAVDCATPALVELAGSFAGDGSPSHVLLSDTVSGVVGTIDPDAVCGSDPLYTFVPEGECEDVNTDILLAVGPGAPPNIIDWTIGVPAAQTSGCYDATLDVYLDAGEMHTLVVRGGPPDPSIELVAIYADELDCMPLPGACELNGFGAVSEVVLGPSVPFGAWSLPLSEQPAQPKVVYYQVLGRPAGGGPYVLASNPVSIKLRGFAPGTSQEAKLYPPAAIEQEAKGPTPDLWFPDFAPPPHACRTVCP